MNLSIASKVSLGIAVAIMLLFLSMQTAMLIGYADINHTKILLGWFSVVFFMPFFFFVVVEVTRKMRYRLQTIDDTLSAINKSSITVELETDGTIVDCNDIFCQAMGYSKEELIGMKHKNLTDPNQLDHDAYDSFWYDLSKGRVKSGEFLRRKKNGDLVWIYGTYNPIMNPYGEVYRVLKIASDITDKKKAEFEINKKNAYLEHAAKILRHDMHSGINTYIPRGLSSLKRRLSTEKISELKIASPLKMISEGLLHTQRVYKGVKEFTNLVKVDSQLAKEKHDLREILLKHLSGTAYIKQVQVEELGEVAVNESLFCTAVDNLIRNGLKYNDSATKSVKIYIEDSFLAIEDNGRGMSQEDFDLMSQPYIRKENQEEQGSGLGLNICVAIMKEHGFEIFCEKIETGTKITIQLK